MQFMRRLTLVSAQQQFIIRAYHIPEIQTIGASRGPSANSGPTVFSHHLQLTPLLEHLISASQDAILNSVAPRTLSSYLTGWNSFKAFHASLGLPFPSLDVLTLTNFITFAHSLLKIKPSTIRVYISGINFFAKLSSGTPCPAASHLHITMLLKGLRKAEPHPTPKRLPLTSDLLTRCIQTLRSGYLSPFMDKALESMFLLAFFGFLRCSEFTAQNSDHHPSQHATMSDISIHHPDTIIYHLKRSKTNQSGPPQPIYIFRLNSYLSPFKPICDYISARLASGTSPQDPLFITETGKGATRTWFHHHFRQILHKSGIHPEYYSGHSFRIGAASTASSQGIPDHVIKILGRWSSPAYLTYIHSNLNDIRNAHQHLSS
ncbi:uncharacterized protein LOC129093883 [Anoplopoma fimbria]|uniref:uncharacterized protein LOC129093883 n=1 Tax=Anoplopoma fimbria TaxID=229290 RepID=UPI0023EBCFB2|nr:uncharacterized protein LOC129093883 [Anoplopoma fimbria]